MARTFLVIVFTLINFISILFLYHHYRGTAQNGPLSTALPPPPDRPLKRTSVETSSAIIEGFEQTFDKKKVNTFLGVPYAQPPLGALRFKAPVEPVSSENRTRIEAIRWPNPCLQPDNHLRLRNDQFSEDCLYLNVWTPNSDEVAGPLLPVVVVIHTGAFLFGSASETTYDGVALAQMANCVVITFNYRLNLLGFYFDPRENITSNVGMLDQVAALKWIHSNVRSFGGDPARVTLIGQSSAGLAVGMHITSPLSRGLFSQAILMSGSPLQTPALSSPEQVDKFWSNYRAHINCSTSDCLVEKVHSNRNSLIRMETVKSLSSDSLFVNAPIVIDGTFQPKSQVELLSSLDSFVANFSLLVGQTDDEGSWIAAMEDRTRFGPKVVPNLSNSEAHRVLEEWTNKMSTTRQMNVTQIREHYLEQLLSLQPQNDRHILSRLVSSVLGDHYIVCPVNLFATQLHRQGANVWQYDWRYKGSPRTSAFWSTFSKVWCGDWMGSCHSFEMFALFGQPFLDPGTFNLEDRIVSRKVIDMVSYFVHQKRLFWPQFTFDPEQQLISKPFYVIDESLTEFKFGNFHRDEQCNQIWSNYIL